MTRYRTIVADPPWRVHQPPVWKVGPNRALPYGTMSLQEIAALPVDELAAECCHLYVWTINRFIEITYELVRGWGFKPSTLLTWAKTPQGMGPGGHYALTTEFVLFARRGVESQNPAVRHPTSWWNWPRGTHSAKPEAFLDIVEQISPAPRAELFARRARFGWDYPIGDQALGGAAV